MKKASPAKKLLAILLSFLVAVGVATPAFAMEVEEDRLSMANLVDDNIAGNLEDESRQVFNMLSYLMQRVNDNDKKAKEYAESWIGIANSYFNPTIGAIKGISSVISLINGTIILLQNLGIIESETDKTQSILDGINSIQLSVNEINKNVDKIQETLVSEFSEIDMKFQEQEYNHYKNEVWAQFYSNSVLPLLNYQNEYNDDVRWLLVNYVEQWQGADGDCPTDLRALYGKDDDGNYIQVYSGKNFGDVGEKLPREPKASVDSAPVEYSVTLPSEYISKNLDELTAISTDNCVDKLIEALEKGVYEAAQDKKLSAYGGFDTEWSYLSETEKREKAKQFAADLADSLAFACAYNAANERRFASNVKSAYENYTKWINGEESLTSPTFAQLKMLALTHGFEGEIRDQAETVITYLMLMNVNFGTFTQTVVSLSKAHGEDDTEDIQTQWASSESSIIRDYTTFLTGNPNYCYQLGKSIEYKNVAITSDFSFTYGTMYNEKHDLLEVYEEYFSKNSWVLSERDAVYSPYKEEELQQRISSGEDLKKRSVSAKDAKLIYTMYQSSGIKGTFADYLAANCVTPDVGIIGNQMITSFSTSNFDLGSGVSMKCYLPVNADSYRFNDGQTYAVNTETSGECDDSGCFLVHDQATGGLFNMNDGTFDENARLAARAFYGESNTFSTDEMYVFSSTNCNNSKVRLSKSEVEDRGIVYYDDHEGYFDVGSEFSTEYGMLVSSEQNSYTFPENTKNVPDRFFGSDMLIRKVIFKGIPKTIGDNAFSGVGTKNNRCLLIVPEGFDTGSLIGKWHGGYFGDAQIILKKNDGTNEEKTAVAVSGASISTVNNPFAAPEGKLFKGWSLSESGNIVLSDKEIVTPGKTLYAVWEYDHEHDFEVASGYVAPTCTENGSTAERTCKICEYKEESQPIAAFGHSCKFTKNDDGNYYAECTECGYSAVLYPTTAGDYTVWCEDWNLFAVEYTVTALYVGCITIKESGVYVIENTDESTVSNHRIKVADDAVVSIGLAGVKNVTYVALPAIDAGNTTCHLTLLDGTENISYGTNYQNAISARGNLIIDGNGSLIAKSQNACGIYASGMNTIISGGQINADCYQPYTRDYYGIGVYSSSPNGRFVISENACVCSTGGINTVPVNEEGEKVYINRIENPDNSPIIIDGKELPYTTAPNETAAFVYLTDEEHDIEIGGESYGFKTIDGQKYYEKQFGGFIVDAVDCGKVSYSGNVLTVKDGADIIVRNANPYSRETTDRIYVPFGACAHITLDGVRINGMANNEPPIKIADSSDGDVCITLAENSENELYGGNGSAGISKNGSAGTLTIDGKGKLDVTGNFGSAAIGSDVGHVVHGIVINDGIINATVNTEYSAAIGSGYIDAQSAPSGDTVYTAEGIIINGGTITAHSVKGAAIGAGYNDKVDGKTFCVKDIVINGGTVNAQSDLAPYSIGAGENTKAEIIRINGGVVTADNTVNKESGGIGAGMGADKIIIESCASVKGNLSDSPVNGEGNHVYLKVTDVDPLSKVVINGTVFPYTDHNGENKLYIYLRLFETADNIPQLVIEESDRGTVTSNPVSPKEGDEVTLSAVANDGYAFKGFEIIPEVEIKDNSFVMPDFGVKVKANFARIGKITVKDCENCTVTPSKSVAASGERITLRIVPDTGMELSRWDVISGNVTVTNNSFIMPEEDVVISGICTPVSYKLTWDVMGYTTTTYLPFGAVIDKHASPEREGYTFDGWTPEVAETMPAEDVTYKAVLTPITYYATFVADGKTVAALPYTMDDESVDEPAIPYKTGYASSWGDYKLDVGGVTVTAEYAPETYIAKFVADGKVIDELPYTVETDYIEEPAIPEKDGYTARWSGYTFHAGGITVNAVYTALTHEHTFNTEYSKNEYSHWYAATCEHTELVKGMQLHSFVKDEDGDGEITYTCSVCGYKKGEDESVKQLAEAQSALDAANKALEEKSAALKTAEETLDKAAGDLKAAQDALKDKTDALNTAEEKLAVADTGLKNAESQISELTSELVSANKELTEAKAALDTANASLETAKTEKADLESQLAEKTAELENLKESAHAKDEEIRDLENSISDLNAAVNAKNVEIAAKSDDIAALEGDISKLENEITSLKNEAAEKNKQIENLSKELEKSKAEIEELKKGENTSCPYCGKEKHESFFDKLACVFKRIGYFFRMLFDFSMDNKN